ncbi:hypothetical protein K8T06_03215 [bacterium]|nr:hypothetical protein [bacterium]
MIRNWILLIALIVLSGCGGSKDTDQPKPTITKPTMVRSIASKVSTNTTSKFTVYPFKSARLSFNIFSPGVKCGTMEIIIDDFGHLESKRSEKLLTDGSKTTIWSIKRGLDFYSMDIVNKEVIEAKLPERKSATIDIQELVRIHGSEEGAEQYLKDQRIRILPNEEIHGYLCQVYEQEINEVMLTRWIHKGIEFRMAISRNASKQEITRELVSVEYDVVVDSSIFIYPENFALKNAVSM